MTARDLAEKAIMQKAVLDLLDGDVQEVRDQLRELLTAGDRVQVTAPDGTDLGMVYVAKPRKTRTARVVDWPALIRWVETNAPEYIVTETKIAPHFIDRLLRYDGEHIDPNGEVKQAEGIGFTTRAPSLTVKPTDAATEAARALIGPMRREVES